MLLTSPRARTLHSAQILAKILALEPLVMDELRGPDHGEADGLPWAQIKEAFGGNPQRHPERPYAVGAETWNAYLERAGRQLQQQITARDGQNILIAGHGETILAANTLLLELPTGLSARTGFTVDHACITCWQQHVNRFVHHTWMMASHNDTTHLHGTDSPAPS